MAKIASQVNEAELLALRQRFPKPGLAAGIYQCAVIVLTNGYLLYLVVTSQSSPVAIAAFNICELIILSVIGHLARVPIPKAQRTSDASTGVVQRIVVLGLSFMWLGFVYSISLAFDKEHYEQLRAAGNPLVALETLNLVWPLLLVALTTLVATIGDWSYWHRHGGLFIPHMAMSGAPKILTLVFAPFPAMFIAGAFSKDHPGTMAIAWSVGYLGIKSVMELGILAFQCMGMPGAPSARASVRPA
jgi:hypothetical protein